MQTLNPVLLTKITPTNSSTTELFLEEVLFLTNNVDTSSKLFNLLNDSDQDNSGNRTSLVFQYQLKVNLLA